MLLGGLVLLPLVVLLVLVVLLEEVTEVVGVGDEHRLFANLELRTGTAFLWNAGGMLEQLQGDEARLAPRVFLNWQAAPRITWRIGHSRAWRQPDLFERNVDIRITDDKGELVQRRQYPNPDLRPQRIDASEIGFLGVFGDSRSTLDVRLFRDMVGDLFVEAGYSYAPFGEAIKSYVRDASGRIVDKFTANSLLNLTDDADAIAQKIRRAKTDPLPMPDTPDDAAKAP